MSPWLNYFCRKLVPKQKIDFVEKPVLKQSSLRHFCQVWQSRMMLASAPKWTKCAQKYEKSVHKYKKSAHKSKVSQIVPKCAHKYEKSAHTSKVSQIHPTGAHKYATNSCGNKKQEISFSKKSSSTVKMDESKWINYAIPALGVKSPSFSNIDVWFNSINGFHWLTKILEERWRRGSVAGE